MPYLPHKFRYLSRIAFISKTEYFMVLKCGVLYVLKEFNWTLSQKPCQNLRSTFCLIPVCWLINNEVLKPLSFFCVFYWNFSLSHKISILWYLILQNPSLLRIGKGIIYTDWIRYLSIICTFDFNYNSPSLQELIEQWRVCQNCLKIMI